jgi:hypothetical protein
MSEKQTCALDALILEYGCFVPIPGDMRADEELRRMLAAQSAARAELAALRRRVEDLELMLCAVRARRLDIWEDEDRATIGYMDADEWQAQVEIRDFDGTGLPLLTDEARAALRQGAAS